MEYFGSLIREARELKNLTVHSLAVRVSLTAATLNKWELHGTVPVNKLDKVVPLLSQELDIDLDRLYSAIEFAQSNSLSSDIYRRRSPREKETWANDYRREMKNGRGVYKRLAKTWNIDNKSVEWRIKDLSLQGYLDTKERLNAAPLSEVCAKGHTMNEENIVNNNGRSCLTCFREYHRNYRRECRRKAKEARQ